MRKPIATEENVVVILERQSKDNEIEKANKGKVVEYKTKETGSLHQAVTMLFSDRNGVHSKHDAIHSFSGELKKQCIASRDRCESCEQDAVSKKRAARRKAFAAKVQQNLQRKPSRTKLRLRPRFTSKKQKLQSERARLNQRRSLYRNSKIKQILR